jgi:hypothetical protein
VKRQFDWRRKSYRTWQRTEVGYILMCDMHCIRNGLERTGGGNRGINSRINDIILRCSKFKYHYIIKKLIITTAITIRDHFWCNAYRTLIYIPLPYVVTFCNSYASNQIAASRTLWFSDYYLRFPHKTYVRFAFTTSCS